jgi:SOS response regulatory protein OraA/RecX
VSRGTAEPKPKKVDVKFIGHNYLSSKIYRAVRDLSHRLAVEKEIMRKLRRKNRYEKGARVTYVGLSGVRWRIPGQK